MSLIISGVAPVCWIDFLNGDAVPSEACCVDGLSSLVGNARPLCEGPGLEM